MRRQRGQSMTEYLVVASAFIGAFLVADASCYEYAGGSCLSKLNQVMHDKYEGYSNSISAVHQYGDYKGEAFESTWTDDDDGDDGDSGSGSAGDIPQDGLIRADTLVSPDGSVSYGTLVSGQYLVDGDGNVIGTYDGTTGTVTMNDGEEYDVLVSTVVLDEDGNPAPLQAVVNCLTQQVLGFGYESGSTGDFHNSVTLEVMDITGLCTAPSYGVVDTDGSPASGAIVGSNYYASTLTVSVDAATPLVPSGEVVYFNIEVPDEDEYQSSDPGVGETVVDCAVMVTGWDADPDTEPLDSYLNSDPNPRVGSLDPAEGVPCTAINTVTD